MTQSEQEKSVVYLLTRKSDLKQYVGITLARRLKQRMGDHKRSKRFIGHEFYIQVLEESVDRSYIESKESYYIVAYDTFNNGLNDTETGKGCGHSSPKFNTLGYIFSDKSRKKMSESAKKRCAENLEAMSERSKKTWQNKEYREHQSKVRQGKRLRPPKLSDESVNEIRVLYNSLIKSYEQRCEDCNKEAVKLGRMLSTPHGIFAKEYHEKYNVSPTTIKNIVLNKVRTKILPAVYNDKHTNTNA